MLLKLEKLIAKYGMKITGVIQAGSHEGEELELFKSAGIKLGHFFEPCSAYWVLSANVVLSKGFDYTSYNYGLSWMSGIRQMTTTQFNKGQSNSLLKPKNHIHHYPNIIFDNAETVYLRTLDSFNITGCNLLVMDTQGTEDLVLKGATETLKHIDYIITEVNLEEMYEGCALIEDLDNYLTDFERVETKLARCKAWGDALYIRKSLL